MRKFVKLPDTLVVKGEANSQQIFEALLDREICILADSEPAGESLIHGTAETEHFISLAAIAAHQGHLFDFGRMPVPSHETTKLAMKVLAERVEGLTHPCVFIAEFEDGAPVALVLTEEASGAITVGTLGCTFAYQSPPMLTLRGLVTLLPGEDGAVAGVNGSGSDRLDSSGALYGARAAVLIMMLLDNPKAVGRYRANESLQATRRAANKVPLPDQWRIDGGAVIGRYATQTSQSGTNAAQETPACNRGGEQ